MQYRPIWYQKKIGNTNKQATNTKKPMTVEHKNKNIFDALWPELPNFVQQLS